MTCPLEKRFVALLEQHGIGFTRPERDRTDPANLDFYIPAARLYVEVKQFHTPRIAGQLAKVRDNQSIMVLVGPGSVASFEMLLAAIKRP